MNVFARVGILVVSFAQIASGQVKPSLDSHIRPVFMSVRRLTLLCAEWNALNPGGHSPSDKDVLNVSPQQMVRAEACDAYILGVYDAQMDANFGEHYQPTRSEIEFMKPLVEMFLAYSHEHPDIQDITASTILNRCFKFLLGNPQQKSK